MYWKKWLIAFAVFIALILLAVALLLPSLERTLKKEVIAAVQERFQSEAELEELNLRIFPTVRASGKNLKLWFHGRRDVPPLISIKEFSFHTELVGLYRTPKHISAVRLQGLVIQIPPKTKTEAQEAANEAESQPKNPKAPAALKQHPKIPYFVIAEVDADGSMIRILPSKPDKAPLEFEVYQLTLQSVGIDRPMVFHATLKNATPPGRIQSNGEFGPWNGADPGETPVAGGYTFRNADLSVFKGIRGHLDSNGEYRGVLSRLKVKGTTNTPDFGLNLGGHSLPLRTKFEALVDGTRGDTTLNPVIARLGSSTMTCKGGVTGKKGQKGKTIKLNVQMQKGRIEDLLNLVIPSKPLMTGFIDFQSDLLLPPEDIDVVQKLILNGVFEVSHAIFKDFTIQQKVEDLSEKSRVDKKDDDDEKDNTRVDNSRSNNERVVSNLSGKFVLRNGIVNFSELKFSVPGALVVLKGSYGIRKEAMDFKGELRMQAKISQTQKGIKSILLKVVDPFFKKKGYGAVIPIKITGTRKAPKFGLNL